MKQQAIEKFVDFNDLDKVIERNKNGCSIKKGAEKFIKTRILKPSFEGDNVWDMPDNLYCYVENIPQVKTRKKLLETGIGELIRSEDIGLSEGWCLNYSEPFCDPEGIITPYVADDEDDPSGKVRVSEALEDLVPRTAILKEMLTEY
jgi:hypothetical protein|tara:strand:+ start:205 stop:645 length:441 start_codon:yes stop_codon:yes gene_type:complete